MIIEQGTARPLIFVDPRPLGYDEHVIITIDNNTKHYYHNITGMGWHENGSSHFFGSYSKSNYHFPLGNINYESIQCM